MAGNLGTQKATAGKQPQVPGHTATERDPVSKQTKMAK